ncbi:MAG: adenylosuccinate lyase [Saprospiraceae bacterium]|nr:adenylosuccinate lyase [Saprospiraceae bacterium]
MLHAISPVDGRYEGRTKSLTPYFSEFGLIRYRVKIEIDYFKKLLLFLDKNGFLKVNPDDLEHIHMIYLQFSTEDAEHIQTIEKTTNHDVKAVEYFIKQKLEPTPLKPFLEFVHFGLTSQDINNTAIPLSHKECQDKILLPMLKKLVSIIHEHAESYKGMPMLARTHGQPASPTTLGKEFMVFKERLDDQIAELENIRIKCKFGGATGNFNAHKVTYPTLNWPEFADDLCEAWGLYRSKYTTQIAHYDDLASIAHVYQRINTILIDMCRDIWSYISMDYFKQKVVAGEIGSSAMPHKVNPIDFENAEGNLGMANAILGHLAEKFPMSRLQRDLTDSTVLRNWGVPFGHILTALFSLEKGLSKIVVNTKKMDEDLDNNWAVVAEAIQNILRREGVDKPYESLKELTRGKSSITKEDIHEFIQHLNVGENVKHELLAITPFNYTGYY